MSTIDHNTVLDYTLVGETYRLKRGERSLVYSPSITEADWGSSKFADYKQVLKGKYYFAQDRRCAYCRTNKIEIDAYYEPLDHVVPKSKRGTWIFYPKNLVVTCTSCNNLKNDDITLAPPSRASFPKKSSGFSIFNPHFDRWSEHFIIEKNIFLRGRVGTKGPETYKRCHLFRYHVAINFSDELRLKPEKTHRYLTHRANDLNLSKEESEQIQLALKHIALRKS